MTDTSNSRSEQESPLKERVKYMQNDELLSRCIHVFHYIEMMRLNFNFDKAEENMGEYITYRDEILRRMI